MDKRSRAPGICGFAVLAVAASFSLAGCRRDKNRPQPPRPPEQIGAPALPPERPDLSEAQNFYHSRCASCHGIFGRGDGSAITSLKLQNKPADWKDRAWHRSITDEEIRNIILYGGAGVGRSADMPAHGDLHAKPRLVRELIQMIRDWGK
jgi:mono/diheme cytochrome c family protein